MATMAIRHAVSTYRTGVVPLHSLPTANRQPQTANRHRRIANRQTPTANR
jgi:hypothetical protein